MEKLALTLQVICITWKHELDFQHRFGGTYNRITPTWNHIIKMFMLTWQWQLQDWQYRIRIWSRILLNSRVTTLVSITLTTVKHKNVDFYTHTQRGKKILEFYQMIQHYWDLTMEHSPHFYHSIKRGTWLYWLSTRTYDVSVGNIVWTLRLTVVQRKCTKNHISLSGRRS